MLRLHEHTPTSAHSHSNANGVRGVSPREMKSAYEADSAIHTFFSLKRLCAVMQQTQPPRRTRSAAQRDKEGSAPSLRSADRGAARYSHFFPPCLHVYHFVVVLFIYVCCFISLRFLLFCPSWRSCDCGAFAFRAGRSLAFVIVLIFAARIKNIINVPKLHWSGRVEWQQCRPLVDVAAALRNSVAAIHHPEPRAHTLNSEPRVRCRASPFVRRASRTKRTVGSLEQKRRSAERRERRRRRGERRERENYERLTDQQTDNNFQNIAIHT